MVSVGDVVDIFTDGITGPEPAGVLVVRSTVVRLLPADGVLFTDRYAAHGQPEAVEFPRCVRRVPLDASPPTASPGSGSPPSSTACGLAAEDRARAVMTYRWQFCGGDDEDSATEVRAWDGAHGDTCIVAVTRTRRGRWRIVSTDYPIPLSGYDRRFAAPIGALEYLARRAGRARVPAVCSCGLPAGAECD